MTLNEAIEHAKEKAAELRERNCIECAVEHEQLVTWLEELSKFQWIPVAERLPDNEGDFIVTANDSITGLFVVKGYCYKGTDGKMRFLNQIDGNLYHNHDGELEFHTRNITAWMPLPEPYTSAGEEAEHGTTE